MKKTVVLAIFTLQGNGAERFALTLAKGLVDAGHNAHIVYFKPIIDCLCLMACSCIISIIDAIGFYLSLCVARWRVLPLTAL